MLVYYISMSLWLQWNYYVRSNNVSSWKIQSNVTVSIGDSNPWVPLFGLKKRPAAPMQNLICTINLLNAALFGGVVAELIARGKSRVYFEWDLDRVYFWSVGLLFPSLFQGMAEYYWHRLMHRAWFYRTFHKLHHYHKSPEPFDDMYTHPLEQFGYYFIFYSPAFLVPVHISSLLLYLAIHGITGVLDHSGVDLQLPFYRVRDHGRIDCCRDRP